MDSIERDVYGFGKNTRGVVALYDAKFLFLGRCAALNNNYQYLHDEASFNQDMQIVDAVVLELESGYNSSLTAQAYVSFPNQVSELKGRYRPINEHTLKGELFSAYGRFKEFQKSFPEDFAVIFPTIYCGVGVIGVVAYLKGIGKFSEAISASDVSGADDCILRLLEIRRAIDGLVDDDKLKVLREKAVEPRGADAWVFFICNGLRRVAPIMCCLSRSLEYEAVEESFDFIFKQVLPHYAKDVFSGLFSDRGLSKVSHLPQSIKKIVMSFHNSEKNREARDQLVSDLTEIRALGSEGADITDPERLTLFDGLANEFFKVLTTRGTEVSQELLRMWILNNRNFVRDFDKLKGEALRRRAEELKAFTDYSMK